MRKYKFRVKLLTTDLINYSVTPKSLVPWTLSLKVKHKIIYKREKSFDINETTCLIFWHKTGIQYVFE